MEASGDRIVDDPGHLSASPAPNPSLDALISERIDAVMTGIILPRLNSIADQLHAAMPTEDRIVQRVLSLQTNVVQAAQPQSNGINPQTHADPVVAMPQPAEAVPPTHWLDKMIPLLDYVFTKWMELQNLKYVQTDVFALAAQLKQTRPLHADVLGQLLAPDPMAPHLPGIMAHTAVSAYDAAQKATMQAVAGMDRASLSPGLIPSAGRLPDNPLGPSSSLNPQAGSSTSLPTGTPSIPGKHEEVILFRQWARG